jgi:hypothetical protein
MKVKYNFIKFLKIVNRFVPDIKYGDHEVEYFRLKYFSIYIKNNE